MLKVKSIAAAAATALALVVTQPKPAEAGDAGAIIAGLAFGAITAGILSHNSRAYNYPPAYYAQPYPYYPTYSYYYAPPVVYAPYGQHYRGNKGHRGGNHYASQSWKGHQGHKNW